MLVYIGVVLLYLTLTATVYSAIAYSIVIVVVIAAEVFITVGYSSCEKSVTSHFATYAVNQLLRVSHVPRTRSY